MRLLHLADVHLGHRQYGLKQRETDVELSFRHALAGVDRHDVDAVLLSGDLFDSRDVRPKTLRAAEDALADVPVPVLVSAGNHDQNMSSRRDVTWLEYLHDAGVVTLLSADTDALGGGPGDPTAFERTRLPADRDDGDHGGVVDLPGDDGPIRAFGLQYRGAYADRLLPDVADAVRATNDRLGDPAATVLLAHFGIDEAVPDLGANVSYADAAPLGEAVDYLALGHIHKRYESGEFAFNPGSPEALDVQEGRWDGHGYYVVDTAPDAGASAGRPADAPAADDGPAPHPADRVDDAPDGWAVTHHRSKRRPYHTVPFDVSDHRTFEDLRGAFESTLDDARDAVEATCGRPIHRAGDGGRRAPIVNVRLAGTLLLDHAAFDLDALCDLARDALDALTVQPTDNTERKAVQDLLGDLDREEAFEADGTVNTDAMQTRVFETIASESRYGDRADDVAATLDALERRVNDEGADPEATADFLRERRRELFPDGPSTEDGEDGTDEAAADTEPPDDAETTDDQPDAETAASEGLGAFAGEDG
jgi:DNA repair exonuclease SbcCD nuclease subunit